MWFEDDKYVGWDSSRFYPMPKEWSGILRPDVSKNRWLDNPYQMRYANNPAVERFLADTFKGRTNVVDRRDKVFRAAAQGDLQPYIDHRKYLQDKGILPSSAQSVRGLTDKWTNFSDLEETLYPSDIERILRPQDYDRTIKLFEHDAFSHAYPDHYFGRVDKTMPYVSAVDEVRANFLDPFIGRSGVADMPDPVFRTDRLPNPVGENIPGAAPYRMSDEFWQSDLRSRGLSSEDLWNSRIRNAMRQAGGRVDQETRALEERFRSAYDDSVLPPATTFDETLMEPGNPPLRRDWRPGMESQFVIDEDNYPQFGDLAERRFPEVAMQDVGSDRKMVNAIFGGEQPVNKELGLNPGVYERMVQKGFLPYAHDLAKAQRLTKYDMAKAGLRKWIGDSFKNISEVDVDDVGDLEDLKWDKIRQFGDESYFAVSPDMAAAKLLADNWRGGVVGAGASLLNPEVAKKAKEGDYLGATGEFGKDVALGALTESGLKGAGNLAQRFAPGVAAKAAPWVGGALNIVGPGVVGAGLFGQGRTDSLTDLAAKGTIGKINPYSGTANAQDWEHLGRAQQAREKGGKWKIGGMKIPEAGLSEYLGFN